MADQAPTTAVIYFLAARDEPDRPRYVGMTTQPLAERLRRHRMRAQGGEGSPKSEWIREVLARGSEIIAVELDIAFGPEAEDHWIKRLTAEGAQLTNARDGGLSGFTVYEDTRRRMGAATTRNMSAPGMREHMSETMRVSHAKPGVREIMHARLRERMADPDVRAKISARTAARMATAKGRAAVQGENQGSSKLTAEQVLAIRRRRRGGEEQKALAAEYGVSKAQISSVVLRKSWRHI